VISKIETGERPPAEDFPAQATVLRWYEPLVVPGLLQTEDYARAILSARPDGNLAELEEQVAARMARQNILDRTGAPQLWCILDEGVLHRAIGGPKVMRGQLYRLAEVAENPRTTIQIVPSGDAHVARASHSGTLSSPRWNASATAAARSLTPSLA
jgi:hypothetical protein